MPNPTPIPLYTTPIPAAQMLDALNGLIQLINAQAAVLASPENTSGMLPWVAARFYAAPPGSTNGTILTVASTIYAYPIFIPGNVPIATISINSTTGQTGGAGHAGIYADNNGAPGALVTGSDSGALAATGTAVATATYTTPLTLTRGWYWLASTYTASGTYPTVEGITALYPGNPNAMIGAGSAADALTASGTATSGVSATFTYGALPAAFPSAGYAITKNATTPGVILGT